MSVATATPAATHADTPIPVSHLDLLERPICGILTTLLSDGQPHSSVMWLDFDGACVRINTTLDRAHARDLTRDPRASLLVVDPDDSSRFLAIRGTIEMQREGAIGHLDALTQKYTRWRAFYGFVYPAEQRFREVRVIGRLHARRITLDAIHAAGTGDQPVETPTAVPTR